MKIRVINFLFWNYIFQSFILYQAQRCFFRCHRKSVEMPGNLKTYYQCFEQPSSIFPTGTDVVSSAEMDQKVSARDVNNPENTETHTQSEVTEPKTETSLLSIKPHQPKDIGFMVTYSASAGVEKPRKTLKFQTSWYSEFTWLHCDEKSGKILCHTCMKAVEAKLIDPKIFKLAETVFISDGFFNWKKGREKFASHQRSDLHTAAKEKLIAVSKPTITSQMDRKYKEDQTKARDALVQIVTSVRYLACQGLALRGKNNDGGNLKKLLELRSEDDKKLSEWLARKTNYTSSEIINEILGLMANDIVRIIASQITEESTHFGIVCDGTRDISGNEQESICFRYITKNLEIREDVVGLYHVKDTSGASLAKMLEDVLVRLQLPLTNLRAQTYDGASNMAGEYNGCQAKIKSKQPLALYTHCGSHVSNLVTSKSVQDSGSTLIRDALDCVHELGKYYQKSGKFKDLYLDQNSSDPEKASPGTLKPICPTRWLTREPAVTSALNNYNEIISALEEAASQFGSTTGSKASTLLKSFKSSKTVLGLRSAQPFLRIMESFNKALQGKNQTVAGMMQSVQLLKNELVEMHTDEYFRDIFEQVDEDIDNFNLEPFELPRKRQISEKIGGGAAGHNYSTTNIFT